jgi:hypothetical protein
MGRWAVLIPGTPSPEILAALEQHGLTKQVLAGFFETDPEPRTTVALQAADEDDAIWRVRNALEDHGDFPDLEAEAFVS